MGRKAKDRTGEVFGLLTAIEDTGKRKYGKPIWKCICECGNFNEVPIYHLRSDHTKSCGCLGERPVNMTLDRIDNDGHYEPSNYKWSTWNDQASNRRPKGVL